MSSRLILPPVSFECSGCGATHHAQTSTLPVGWTACDAQAWCLDCTAQGVPAREMGKPASRRITNRRASGRRAA
jgi:hypothetical protein